MTQEDQQNARRAHVLKTKRQPLDERKNTEKTERDAGNKDREERRKQTKKIYLKKAKIIVLKEEIIAKVSVSSTVHSRVGNLATRSAISFLFSSTAVVSSVDTAVVAPPTTEQANIPNKKYLSSG